MANPLSRRLLQLAGLLSLLLIAVVVNYLLHDGSDVVNPIARAAQRTAAMPGARLRFEVTYSAEGSSKTITGTGDGVYDGRTGRSDVQMTMPLPDGRSLWVESLGDQRNIFTRSSSLESTLPPGKLWLGMQPLLGHEPVGEMSGGPGAEGMLEELKAAGGDVEEVDHQTVGGHPTTRYKTSIDPAREADVAEESGDQALAREYEAIAERAPEPIEVEVWIDGHGLARMIAMVEKLPITPDGKTLDVTTRIEFFAFGHRSRIPLPPKRKVFDYTPVLRAELGLEDGSILGRSGPPAGAKPLSISAFRRQANAICSKALADSKSFLRRDEALTARFGTFGPADLGSAEAKSLLHATGRLFEGFAEGTGRRMLDELAAVAPPARDLREYRRFLKVNAQELETLVALARINQLGVYKVPGVDRKAVEARRTVEQEKLAASLGVPACAPHSGSEAGLDAQAA